MASIELSNNWVSAMIPRLFTFPESDNSNKYANASIYVMKGVMPTSVDSLLLESWDFSNELNPYKASVLVKFFKQNFSLSEINTNPIVIKTEPVQAIASGRASWFCCTINSNSSANLQIYAIGSISVIGSGADLEIKNFNISANEYYSIDGLIIQFPTSWVY